MTSVLQRFKRLSTIAKIEIIVALVMTIALITAIPVYAWFNNQKKIAKLAKIKAPDELYINAAHKEDIVNLDMTTVDVSQEYTTTENGDFIKKSITSQSYVFTISGEWVNSYTLQIEHTTNNPFTYSFHKGEIYKNIAAMKNDHPDWESRNDDGSLKYVEYRATNVYDLVEQEKIPSLFTNDDLNISTGEKYYIWIGDEITNKEGAKGAYLNQTGSEKDERYATDYLIEKSYESGTQYQQYAKPLFWQLRNIKASDSKAPFFNTYVIKIDWNGITETDLKKYKKETDIFYISAFVE